jgi:hypothetical protein
MRVAQGPYTSQRLAIVGPGVVMLKAMQLLDGALGHESGVRGAQAAEGA